MQKLSKILTYLSNMYMYNQISDNGSVQGFSKASALATELLSLALSQWKQQRQRIIPAYTPSILHLTPD